MSLELELYLNALFGAEPAGALIEVRHKLPGGGMAQDFFEVGQVHRAAERILELGQVTDTYVGVAPRARRCGKKDAVERVHVLWADCDGAEAVAALESFEPGPAIIIGSGSGPNVHAYWPLFTPLDAPAAERANRRLAYRLGSDPQVADAGRILRPPGTLNHKPELGFPATVSARKLEVEVYEAAEVIGHLPDPPEVQRAQPAPPRVSGDDPLLNLPPALYVERLAGLVPGRDGKVTCPFHDDRTPSLHVYEDPEKGWVCFGCGRAGTIYDFAAGVWGAPSKLRGGDFLEVRRRLLEVFA
ncbi:MAG: CHC2 zinc finger domain-containing protein [Actinomycetota bacterium]|nr:CHC2 zinc finger domain-containing protein [Actinomycetota bacterium]